MCRRCLRFDKLNIPVYFELCVTRCSTFSIAGNVERFLGKIILRWDRLVHVAAAAARGGPTRFSQM
jgi:hypothetical protein